jgi:hypothetical protein
MKKINSIFIFILSVFISISSSAQEKNALILRTTVKTLQPNLEHFVNHWNGSSESYQLMQFNSIPSNDNKKNLEKLGIDFLEYIPNNTYLIKISPLLSSLNFLKEHTNISGIHPLPRELKIDYRIIEGNIPSHAIADDNTFRVAIIAMNGLKIKNYSSELGLQRITPYEYGNDSRFAYCALSKNQIDEIVKKPWVRSIELIDEPGKPESTEGRSIQKSNVINNHLPNGLNYDGSGVSLLVRDDGLVGPHIDYTGRLTNLTNDATGTHGDGVAGVMGAAGNVDPSVEGGSSGADIYVINYVANFQDNTMTLHQTSDVKITNSSYSNGCNAGYTSTSQTVDQQVFDNPSLMHVFSAGNSNNNDCGYGAGDQWGNITGGHKVGKNVIAVANLNNDGSLVGSSSRGPAHDGRIKPDLAAHGQGQVSTDPNHQYSPFGGTSSAAPSLAGNLGQLIEAYRDLNNNADPKSSLLKAAAMNSATDLGNKGPDYKFGYGMIHTARAYDIIANNQFLFDTISQADSNTHTVTVPAGTGQLRIMLYWHDPQAAVNTNKALINDLDMVVNNSLLPLVLDPTPNASTLDNPAVPGIDRLNNVEQIVVDSPAAGTYSVKIKGFQIPSGPQEYVLVYSFIENDIKVTYPLGGESLIPGRTEIIHWDAYGDQGMFDLDYSTDNGSTWNNIASVSGSIRNYSWQVPNINSADALIRVSRATQSDVSDAPFNIFPIPAFTIQTQTVSSLEMNWAAIPTATKYYIWRLGAKYMEIIDSSATNQYTLGGLQNGDNLWLSVSASTTDITGERANAQNFIFNSFASCPGCISSVTTFPAAESFELDFGMFCQFTTDDIDFSRNSGGTFTSNTGPSSASDGSTYIYLEASNPNNPSKRAILGSPCYDLSDIQSAALEFDYHMYGNGMGTLRIEVSTDGGQTWNNTPIWGKSGNQGDQWYSESIDFSSYQTSNVSFRFVGNTGNSARSDMAIDNIYFTVVPNFPLSVDNISDSKKYSIQPNPSDGIFKLNTIENIQEIKIMNSYGQIIRTISNQNAQSQTIDLGGQAAGIYFVVIKDTSKNYHRMKVSIL